MILISIASHLYEFEENIKALWHKVQIKTDLCDVTLSCEDKQMKIHRFIISSYSPIDDLSLKVVTKTSITTKESIEFYQVYNDNIKKNMESTVELQDNVENHLCNLCEYTTLNVSYLKRHTETCHEGVFYSCCQCDYKANMSHPI